MSHNQGKLFFNQHCTLPEMSSTGISGGGDWTNKLAWWPNAALKSASYSWGFENGEPGKKMFFANCEYDLSKVRKKCFYLQT